MVVRARRERRSYCAFVGGDPVRAFLHIVEVAFGSVGVISDTLVKATPLILTGLACSLAFRMRLWNIGAEGQFLLGAWGASAVVLVPILPAGTPAIVVIPAMMVAGALAGGAWGFIPGILRARLGVNEIITTPDAQLRRPVLDPVLGLRAVERGRLPADPPVPARGLAAATDRLRRAVPDPGWPDRAPGPDLRDRSWRRSCGSSSSGPRWGYEIRLIGDNPRAARYAGIDIARKILIVFIISGALAGLGGMSEVTGVVHRLQDRISPGYGFTAIIIAYLAHFGPFRVMLGVDPVRRR